MNKRHYEHTLPNIRGSLSNTYDKMKGCNGRTDLRILRGEHNHTGIQPLQLFPEKEDYTTGKTERHPLGEKQAND